MPSSTSSSSSAGDRHPASTGWRQAARVVLLAVAALLLVLAPVETAVRLVEARHGERARFGHPGSDAGKLAWFLELMAESGPATVLVLGNSQAEYGIDPAVLATALGIGERDVYNLSFSGTSVLAGLEIVRRYKLAPRLVIACVSPADLSRPMIERGEQLLAARVEGGAGAVGAAASTASASGLSVAALRQDVDGRIAGGLHRVLRASDPRYRRSPADWWRLARAPGAVTGTADIGRFLTTGRLGRETHADGRYHIPYLRRGFIGLEMLRPWADRAEFERLAVAPSQAYYRAEIFPSYGRERTASWAALGGHVRALAEAGTRVVIVRMPAWRDFLALEDRETGFAADLAAFAAAHGTSVVLPDAPALAEFLDRPAHFRDAVHLHAASAGPWTRWLAERIGSRAAVSGSSGPSR